MFTIEVFHICVYIFFSKITQPILKVEKVKKNTKNLKMSPFKNNDY